MTQNKLTYNELAFKKGFDAFTNPRYTNPYKASVYSHKEWERGFNKAYFENLRKLNEQTGRGS